MEIIQPHIGQKQSPLGVHPAKYLQELPELDGYIVIDAIISYVNTNGLIISITSQSDWHMFFQSLDHGSPGRLKLKFPEKSKQATSTSSTDSYWSALRAVGREALGQVSSKMRTFGKQLLNSAQVEETAFEKQLALIESQGFSEFDAKGLLFEELGVEKKHWDEMVDQMKEYGFPEKWTKSLKLAAKNKRGSVKSLMSSSHKEGVRTMMYMKFQIFPDGNDGIDGLFAIYKLDATSPEQATSPKTENNFKKYVEMDAQREWKREVGQFLPDTNEPKAEL